MVRSLSMVLCAFVFSVLTNPSEKEIVLPAQTSPYGKLQQSPWPNHEWNEALEGPLADRLKPIPQVPMAHAAIPQVVIPQVVTPQVPTPQVDNPPVDNSPIQAAATQPTALAPAPAPTDKEPAPVVAADPEPLPQPIKVAAKASEVDGVTTDEIRFGIAAPFSGSAKELGRQMKLGIEAAFDVANDAGGIEGRRLKLSAVDDGYEPSRTGDAMKELVERDHVFGIIGNVGTPTAAIALPYALEHKMLFFGALTGANILRPVPPDHYVFNYRPSYAEETEAVVKYLVTVRGLKPRSIAVLAQSDSYGDAGYAGVAKALRGLGTDNGPPLRLPYTRNTIDVDEAVAKLRGRRATIKAVVMVATYRAAAKFIEKTRNLYPDLIYTNVSFVGSTALSEELMLLGSKYADKVIVTQVVPDVSGSSKTVLDYKAALAKYFPGEAPNYISFEGYVDAKILIEGLKRTGADLTTEKLVDALETMKGVDLGLGTAITFGQSEHQGSHKIWGTQLDDNGHFAPLDLE